MGEKGAEQPASEVRKQTHLRARAQLFVQTLISGSHSRRGDGKSMGILVRLVINVFHLDRDSCEERNCWAHATCLGCLYVHSSGEPICPHSAQRVTLLCSQEYVHVGWLGMRQGSINTH